MKCSVCSSYLDNVGDGMYYCPRCKKMYGENEAVRETKYEFEKTDNYSYEAENREMPDVFDNSRNQYYEDTGSNYYDDKPEMIDETKPQRYEKSASVYTKKTVTVKNTSANNISISSAKQLATITIILFVCSLIFSIFSLPSLIIAFVNANKLKNPPPDCENPAEYKKHHKTCITCAIIQLIFLIAKIVFAVGYIYILESALR